MENVAINQTADVENIDATDLRTAPRFTLLIRAAKLVGPQGEFVCVIRDVSETGISVRLFHSLPKGDLMELHMPGGCVYTLKTVWDRDNEAGFEFAETVDIGQLIHEAGEYPKRGLRLSVCFPVTITSSTGNCEAIVENFSQQGARIECSGHFASDQSLLIDANELQGVRAKVRWRREGYYGLVFDDTLTLGDFARLTARMQAPNLLDS